MGRRAGVTPAETARARKGQRRAVAVRKCPKCLRGNALSRVGCADAMPGEVTVYCRFCNYARIRP